MLILVLHSAKFTISSAFECKLKHGTRLTAIQIYMLCVCVCICARATWNVLRTTYSTHKQLFIVSFQFYRWFTEFAPHWNDFEIDMELP